MLQHIEFIKNINKIILKNIQVHNHSILHIEEYTTQNGHQHMVLLSKRTPKHIHKIVPILMKSTTPLHNYNCPSLALINKYGLMLVTIFTKVCKISRALKHPTCNYSNRALNVIFEKLTWRDVVTTYTKVITVLDIPGERTH